MTSSLLASVTASFADHLRRVGSRVADGARTLGHALVVLAGILYLPVALTLAQAGQRVGVDFDDPIAAFFARHAARRGDSDV